MRSRTLVGALGASLLIWLATFAGVVSADPPGNNGTIKVDAETFDTHPNNEPHVDCAFQIDFYGFDEGTNFNADVMFEAHPPTGHGVLLTDTVFIGEDDNGGGGSEAGLDAEVEYNLGTALQSFTPHPQQGFHVKLTVHADGSQGADTKHKVFWVQGCATTTPPPPPPGGGGGGGGGGGTTVTTPPTRSGTLPSTGGPTGGNLPNTAVLLPIPVDLMGIALLFGAASLVAAQARGRPR